MIWRHTFFDSLEDDPRRFHNLTIVGGGWWKPILVYSSGPTFELELELESDMTWPDLTWPWPWPWPYHVLTLSLTKKYSDTRLELAASQHNRVFWIRVSLRNSQDPGR